MVLEYASKHWFHWEGGGVGCPCIAIYTNKDGQPLGIHAIKHSGNMTNGKTGTRARARVLFGGVCPSSSRGLGACVVHWLAVTSKIKNMTHTGTHGPLGDPRHMLATPIYFLISVVTCMGFPRTHYVPCRYTPDTKKGPSVGVLRTHYVAMGNMGGLPGGL